MNSNPINKETRFLNGTDRSAKVILEPWGEEYVLGPGSTVGVKFSGDPKSELLLEVEYVEGGFIVYFPPGFVAEFVQ